KALARRALLPFALTVGVGGLALAVLLYLIDGSDTLVKALAFTGVFVPLVLMFVAPGKAVARAGDQIGRPIGVKIDAGGVHTTDGFSTTTLGWSEIKTVRSARGQIVLSLGWRPGGKLATASIPTTGLNPAEKARLLAVLDSRGAALTKAPAS
ncbi:hypothetical protein, partial [Actinoplanes xinjiangensis]|uniref:hypothetical protein n=1 Tax=Actinoplanes xinjiangensis TaxID=512350 RepID=UPI003437F1B5